MPAKLTFITLCGRENCIHRKQCYASASYDRNTCAVTYPEVRLTIAHGALGSRRTGL